MEEKHRCKLCYRSFGSGRALGGHMRSHMMKLSLPSKQPEQEDEEQQFYDDDDDLYSYSSTSSYSSEEDEEDQEVNKELTSFCQLQEEINFNQKAAVVEDHLQDRESETELSRRYPVCRRSKRVRKSRSSNFNGFTRNAFFQAKKLKLVKEARTNNTDDYEHSLMESSISDTTPEEHVAHCLIMLSRDKWTREVDEDEDEDEGEEAVMEKTSATTKAKAKYRCETCNKVFKSHQALGGHRASHNKVKVNAPEKFENSDSSPAASPGKTHECPFCHRIFASGQALGGHKRSHFTARGGAVKSRASRSGEILGIDLNLPAPTDDDENSQIDVSAVSDAEFVH